MSFLARGKRARSSSRRRRRGRPPADSKDSGKPIAKEQVWRERKEVSRSKTKKPTPNGEINPVQSQLNGRKPEQSRLGYLRENSQTYLGMD